MATALVDTSSRMDVVLKVPGTGGVELNVIRSSGRQRLPAIDINQSGREKRKEIVGEWDKISTRYEFYAKVVKSSLGQTLGRGVNQNFLQSMKDR